MAALLPKSSSLWFLIFNSLTVSAAGARPSIQGGEEGTNVLDCTDHLLLTCSLVYIKYVAAVQVSLTACTNLFSSMD